MIVSLRSLQLVNKIIFMDVSHLSNEEEGSYAYRDRQEGKKSSSIQNFRHMLQQLRNRNNGHSSPNELASIRPQSLKKDDTKLDRSSSSARTDDPIKLKEKSTVNGRDGLMLRDLLPITHSIESSHLLPRIARKIETRRIKKRELQTGRPVQIETSRESITSQGSFAGKSEACEAKHKNKYSLHRYWDMQPSERSAFPESEENKKGLGMQKRFNISVINNRRVHEMSVKQVVEYCKKERITSESSPDEINLFFTNLLMETGIFINRPQIKKYRNCVYFGEKDQGVLYYFTNRIYYGSFQDLQKNGKGVDIQLDHQGQCNGQTHGRYGAVRVFRGQFVMGRKTGNFIVDKPQQRYEGFMEDGVYQGHGILSTLSSKYEGQFWKGFKHGVGRQQRYELDFQHHEWPVTVEAGCFYKGKYVGSSKAKAMASRLPEVSLAYQNQALQIKHKEDHEIKKETKQSLRPEQLREVSNFQYEFDKKSCRDTQPIQEIKAFGDNISQIESEKSENQYGELAVRTFRKQTSNTTQAEEPLPLPTCYSKNFKESLASQLIDVP